MEQRLTVEVHRVDRRVRIFLPSCQTLANCAIHHFCRGIGGRVSAPGWLIVIVERNNSFYTIASAEDALDLLFSDWPVNSGAAFISAMEACAGTATGLVTQEEAQWAFLLAADEANVLFRFV
ncbi:DUF982 domain-containing protein [Rhizobium tibeticum]|uniref:DUF982 domain-containing protein n=1 Tax=Rhizobium tibeticum TaxID=501024 RepID=UPI003139E215